MKFPRFLAGLRARVARPQTADESALRAIETFLNALARLARPGAGAAPMRGAVLREKNQ